jgi:hypothetical protein
VRRVDGELSCSCFLRFSLSPLLKAKVFLLAGAVAAAHCAGAIPHEKSILSWGAATVRREWRHLKVVAHATHVDRLVATGKVLLVRRLCHDEWQSLGTGWTKMATAVEAFAYYPETLSPSTPDPFSLAPPCSLRELNQEYIRVLLVHRRQASHDAPNVTFDAELFKGCREFNKTLERENQLRHDPAQPGAELAGMSTALVRDDPAALAKYIWTQFHNSPRHSLIQADPSLTLVAVSATAKYWVVRFQTR